MICDLLIGSYNNYRHAIWETYFIKYIITYTTHVRLKHTLEIIKGGIEDHNYAWEDSVRRDI